jgi:hypothetical protein
MDSSTSELSRGPRRFKRHPTTGALSLRVATRLQPPRRSRDAPTAAEDASDMAKKYKVTSRTGSPNETSNRLICVFIRARMRQMTSFNIRRSFGGTLDSSLYVKLRKTSNLPSNRRHSCCVYNARTAYGKRTPLDGARFAAVCAVRCALALSLA